MRLFEALVATWPPAETRRLGGWTLRRGEGGGNRVSAATLDGARGRHRRGRGGDARLGPAADLHDPARRRGARPPARGARLRGRRPDADRRGAARRRSRPPSPTSGRSSRPAPLAAMREIWAAGGVGPSRLAVMARAVEPEDLPARPQRRRARRPAPSPPATARSAMLQALEVARPFRRQGLGTALTRAAAAWVAAHGADDLRARRRGRQRPRPRRLRAARHGAGRRLPLPARAGLAAGRGVAHPASCPGRGPGSARRGSRRRRGASAAGSGPAG